MKLTSSGDNFLSFPLAPPNFISFLFISWLSDDLVVWLERSWLSDSRLPVVWLALSYCVVWLVPYCCLTRLGVVWLMLSDSQPCCLTRSSPVLSWTSRTPSLSSTQPRPTHRCSRFDRCCRGLPGRSFPRPPQQYLTESTAEGRDSLHWFQGKSIGNHGVYHHLLECLLLNGTQYPMLGHKGRGEEWHTKKNKKRKS